MSKSQVVPSSLTLKELGCAWQVRETGGLLESFRALKEATSQALS